MSSKSSEAGFRLDKTVTLSIIFAIIMQTAGALIWAGSAQARLLSVEKELASYQQISERMVRMEEQMLMVRASLERIEGQLSASQ